MFERKLNTGELAPHTCHRLEYKLLNREFGKEILCQLNAL